MVHFHVLCGIVLYPVLIVNCYEQSKKILFCKHGSINSKTAIPPLSFYPSMFLCCKSFVMLCSEVVLILTNQALVFT